MSVNYKGVAAAVAVFANPGVQVPVWGEMVEISHRVMLSVVGWRLVVGKCPILEWMSLSVVGW